MKSNDPVTDYDRLVVLALFISLALLCPHQQQRVAPAQQPTSANSPAPTTAPQPTASAPDRTRIDKGRRVRPAQAGVALPADTITVVLPQARSEWLDATHRSGRLILFFRALDSRASGDPSMAPFFEDPQPIASIQVAALAPGVPIEFAASSVWWPGGSELFEGEYEVQAVFDVNESECGHLANGNLSSEPVTILFNREAADVVALELSQKITALALPALKNVVWIDHPSALLSAAAERAVTHRAAVIFPVGYHDIRAKRRIWPTVYVVPGFGGRFTDAIDIAAKVDNPALAGLWPQAVYVILDPESAFGHHGFVDSPANGPRGTALVTELIPYLETRFRLIRHPSARVVTGHSSGGWTSVWLTINHPKMFGGAFASSPDPLDFSAFEMSDLYRDINLYTADDGTHRPSFRQAIGPSHDLVPMLVRDEVGMEYALSPQGSSGQQWDSWAAMFSPIATGGGEPRRLCDAHTGVIDAVTVEAWSHYDIARRVRQDWSGIGEIFVERVRVIVGERDSFYLERAAIRLRDSIDEHMRQESAAGRVFATGPGYIEIVPGATHDSVYQPAQVRFNHEIRAFFHVGAHHD
ncbi:MAG: hypothetical protein EXS17_04325 [Phycisphaerales bacterium]|nr:hypothetical protein [Phycisphaerales bacterium]